MNDEPSQPSEERTDSPPPSPKEEPPVSTSPTTEEKPSTQASVSNEAAPAEKWQAAARNLRSSSVDNREMLQAAASYINSAQIANLIIQQGSGVQYSPQFGPPLTQTMRVSSTELDRIWNVYVKPTNYQDVCAALGQLQLVILQGRPQVGKRSMALYLLQDILGQQLREVHDLPVEVDLIERLKPANLEGGQAYILDGLPGLRAEKMAARHWETLSSQLKQAGCYLVVCLNTDVRLPTDLRPHLRHLVTEPTEPPRLLIERHIRYQFELDGQDYPEQAVELCFKDKQIGSLLDSPLPPARAYQLATLLLPHLRNECTLPEALGNFAAYSEDIVQDWFDACGEDLDERAFRIALAIFDGARYTEVDTAARDLSQQTRPAQTSKRNDAPPSPSPFSRPRSHRLEQARAHLETVQVATEYSDHTEVQIVRLQDPSYQNVLLKYIWKEYPDFHDILLHWLDAYANARTADMRHRAAAAVGALALLDFERLRKQLLEPWARRSETDRELGRIYRAALSTAMLIISWDDNQAENVLGLLRYWSEHSKESLVWAAARCYATVGLRYPREAMERWRTILEKYSQMMVVNFNIDLETLTFSAHPIVVSILDAILALFTGAFEWPERFQLIYSQLLEATRGWVLADQDSNSKARLGMALFMLMMSIPMPLEEENPDLDRRPPALLSLFTPQAEKSPALEHLVWLLRQVLNDKNARSAALDLLHYWVAYVETDHNLLPSLQLVLSTYLATPDLRPRERDRLDVYLRRWAISPRKPLSIAAELRSTLSFE